MVPSIRVKGDVAAACIEYRSDLVVARRISSSMELASQVVPYSFEPDATEHVVAAVSGGPHSPLAARVARRLGEVMGVKTMMVCAYRDDSTQDEAVKWVERLYHEVPGIEYRMIEAADADGLVSQLPDHSALVIGAPGGSWLQRTFFGQGARLRQRAAAGVLVVQNAEERIFQAMEDPVFVGSLREVGDVLRIHSEPILAVADRAFLVGIVNRDELEALDPTTMVVDAMQPPVSVMIDAPLADTEALREQFEGGSIPVIDTEGHLVGGVTVGD